MHKRPMEEDLEGTLSSDLSSDEPHLDDPMARQMALIMERLAFLESKFWLR